MSIGERGGAAHGAREATPTSRSSAPTEGSGEAASDATDRAREVVSEAAHQAGDVMAETRHELSALARETAREARQQVDTKGAEYADRLRTLAAQLDALADGRTDETGELTRRVQTARALVERLADRLAGSGTQGVVHDVTQYARRRPGAFLVGAVVAGIAAGRLTRISSDASSESTEPLDGSSRTASGTTDQTLPAPMAATTGADLP